MPNETDEPKKTLARDEILNAETPSKVYDLPSGIVIRVKYLAYFLVKEIYTGSESTLRGEKERIFTEKVIKWMLRENDQQELGSFSEEDQLRLIEIAAEEWGCKEEYESLSTIANSEGRFYQAVTQQERELARILSEGLKQITANLAFTVEPLKNIQINIASSLKGMIDEFNFAPSVSDTLKNINLLIFDQLKSISTLTTPIVELVEDIQSMPGILGKPLDKSFLSGIRETIISYQSLMENTLPLERYASLPDSVRYYPTIEMHNTSVVTERLITTTPQKKNQEIIFIPNIDELMAWLSNLDPYLPKMLQGAKETIFSDNPDHCRHFASSCRELSTHILHLLAPDDHVKQWTTDSNCFVNGQPKRTTRLKYIARNHENEPFIEFLVRDFESQMRLFNADEHRVEQNYSEIDLLFLYERFLSLLNFLRQIIISQS